MTRRRWLAWVPGLLLLAVVIALALRYSEGEAFVQLARQAHPWWLALAGVFQLSTYVAQGGIWRDVARTVGAPLAAAPAFRLSVAKVFADQALPSAGISGSIVVARTLAHSRMPAKAVNAAVLLNLATYHTAYLVTLLPAVALLVIHGHGSRLVLGGTLAFSTFAVAMTAIVLSCAGSTAARFHHLRMMPGVAAVLRFLEEADPVLVRSPRLLATATALQVAMVLLDTATMWALLRAFDSAPPIGEVFSAFMLASLVRTLGVLPGGIGTFEATSVFMLTIVGVALPAALAATLLFRGLSFWLPMVPGAWLTRHAVATPASRGGEDIGRFWAMDAASVMARVGATPGGLTAAEAARRLDTFGMNAMRDTAAVTRWRVLLNQLRSPLLLLLLFAAAASAATGEWVDTAIVMAIVATSVAIGYSREYAAQSAAAALHARIHIRARVLRDGGTTHIDSRHVVPGDILLLAAGSLVPADALVLDATDCYVSEAVLTGESFPVAKSAAPVSADAPLRERANCVHLGTNVRSGSARCVVVHTGPRTEFGAIADRLATAPPETEFERGIRRFGYLLTSAMLVLVLIIFTLHVLSGRSPVDTLLFAIALAVGLSPELLPAILGVNLARGARAMASRGVLVRRLNAIENLGSMDVLCTDKTGTLTEGIVRLDAAYDARGNESATVLELAALNAALETGLENPLDDAVLAARRPDLAAVRKAGEIPFDFTRKRLSIALRSAAGIDIITKGSFAAVLDVCTRVEGGPLTAEARAGLVARYEAWSHQGIRVIAVATRQLAEQAGVTADDERDMEFVGFLTFLDRPHPSAAAAIADLAGLGVRVKVITGDSGAVTRHIATQVGLADGPMLSGREIDTLAGEALWRAAEQATLFVEVTPQQKERIIIALRHTGHVVGFLGDGVNDAPAMHAADTSLSVERAVDVAREAADFVLVEPGLGVIRRGIEEGRRTFANTLKYVLTTTSANLGNMVSMAVVSLFLPFLPLLAGQILLNNLLSDVPAVGIADDNVDPELVARPERWNMRFIGRFMVEFGLLSSLFDLLTFVVLLAGFGAAAALFRTAWFVESLLTELLVALVVRTRRPLFHSRPGAALLASTALVIPLAFLLPFLPRAEALGFTPLPASVAAVIAVIALLYVAAAEQGKRLFYRRLG